MNQNSIELLSSEELENVAGGILDEVISFGKGFVYPFYSCYVTKDAKGQFDIENLPGSIGQAISSTVLIASLATTVYSTYKSIRSKLGKKEVEGKIKEDATTV